MFAETKDFPGTYLRSSFVASNLSILWNTELWNLLTHLVKSLIHYSNVIFVTIICSQMSIINKHVAGVHEENKTFKCDVCDYSCSQKCQMSICTRYICSWKKYAIQIWDLGLQFFCKEPDENTYHNGSWRKNPIQMWHLWLQLFSRVAWKHIQMWNL